MSKPLDEVISEAFTFLAENTPKELEGSFLPRLEAIENYLNLQIDLRVRANENFDLIVKSLREMETRLAKYAALREAGQAVVDRWHTPLWVQTEHTGVLINALEKALKGGV